MLATLELLREIGNVGLYRFEVRCGDGTNELGLELDRRSSQEIPAAVVSKMRTQGQAESGNYAVVCKVKSLSIAEKMGVRAGDLLCLGNDKSFQLARFEVALALVDAGHSSLMLLREFQVQNGAEPKEASEKDDNEARLWIRLDHRAKTTEKSAEDTTAAFGEKKDEEDEEDSETEDDYDDASVSSDSQSAPSEKKKETPTQKKNWDSMLEKLKEYGAKHAGDLNVPSRYKDVPSLGWWVESQRSTYRQGQMLQRRYNALKAIGFPFKVDRSRETDKQQKKWDEMFEKLKKHKNKHGHLGSLDPKLSGWARLQRHTWREKKMLSRRYKLLEEIGFCFSIEGQVVVPCDDSVAVGEKRPRNQDSGDSESQVPAKKARGSEGGFFHQLLARGQ